MEGQSGPEQSSNFQASTSGGELETTKARQGLETLEILKTYLDGRFLGKGLFAGLSDDEFKIVDRCITDSLFTCQGIGLIKVKKIDPTTKQEVELELDTGKEARRLIAEARQAVEQNQGQKTNLEQSKPAKEDSETWKGLIEPELQPKSGKNSSKRSIGESAETKSQIGATRLQELEDLCKLRFIPELSDEDRKLFDQGINEAFADCLDLGLIKIKKPDPATGQETEIEVDASREAVRIIANIKEAGTRIKEIVEKNRIARGLHGANQVKTTPTEAVLPERPVGDSAETTKRIGETRLTTLKHLLDLAYHQANTMNDANQIRLITRGLEIIRKECDEMGLSKEAQALFDEAKKNNPPI